MNTKVYEYIIAVAEQKNITKAAEQCYISQPALTQHIKKLESQFGFPIFEKQADGLVPTRLGEIFLTTARRILQIERETLRKLEEHKRVTPSVYRVFIDTHIRNLFIEKIWPQFLETYPDIKLSLVSGNTETALEYLEKQLVDAGIFPLLGTVPASLDYVPVDQNEYLLLLPKEHPCAKTFEAHGIDFRLLKGETFIFDENFSLFGTLQYKILERYGIVPKEVMYSHSMQTIVRMVEHGQGVSLIPDVIVKLTDTGCPAYSLDPPWYFHHVISYNKAQGLNAYHALLADLFIRHYSQFHN